MVTIFTAVVQKHRRKYFVSAKRAADGVHVDVAQGSRTMEFDFKPRQVRFSSGLA